MSTSIHMTYSIHKKTTPMWTNITYIDYHPHIDIHTPPKTNMTMVTQPFEDASPINNCDFPMSS